MHKITFWEGENGNLVKERTASTAGDHLGFVVVNLMRLLTRIIFSSKLCLKLWLFWVNTVRWEDRKTIYKKVIIMIDHGIKDFSVK